MLYYKKNSVDVVVLAWLRDMFMQTMSTCSHQHAGQMYLQEQRVYDVHVIQNNTCLKEVFEEAFSAQRFERRCSRQKKLFPRETMLCEKSLNELFCARKQCSREFWVFENN